MKIKKDTFYRELKRKLEYHYKRFDRESIAPDPVEFPLRITSPPDREIASFISAVMAYGNVRQINTSLKNIFTFLGNHPYDAILNFSGVSENHPLSVKHRFYSSNDIGTLFYVLNHILLKYGSLKIFFLKNYDESDENVGGMIEKTGLEFYSILDQLKIPLTHGLKFMFPRPSGGSACKRINLFLRWMVRKDQIDFGLWNEIPASKLIIPVDIHIARISRDLGLTNQKSVSWRMAEEITENLKKFDQYDPVKYDFALCHIGMRKERF